MLHRILTELLKNTGHDINQLYSMHHIQGLAYFIKLDQSKQYKSVFIQQWSRNQKSLDAFNNLRQKLGSNVSNPIVLKGASILDQIYPEYGSRFMCDIDFLIQKKDLNPWESVLENQGYTKTVKSKEKRDKTEWSKFIDGDEIVLELHLQIYENMDIDWPLNTHQTQLENVDMLEIHEQIVHMASHVSIGHNFLKLYWLIDIYLLINKEREKIDLSKLRNLAIKYKCVNGLETTLYVLNKFFNTGIKHRFKLAQLFINKDLIVSNKRRSMRYILLKFFIRDKAASSLIYLKNHIHRKSSLR